MKYKSLSELFTDTANAIRGKTGGTEPIVAEDFPTAIEGISVGGGGLGEVIAYNYGLTLPDINEIWNGRVKEKFPYALITMYNQSDIDLWLYELPFAWQPNRFSGLKAEQDIIGVRITYDRERNQWGDDSYLKYFLDNLDNWWEYIAYEGDVLFGVEDENTILWMSENYEWGFGTFKTNFSDPVPVYSVSGALDESKI